jgi:antitoxin FitA
MTTITVPIPDECLSRLTEVAAGLRVAPEDLVLVSIEELLARPEDSFRHALDYVLDKNAELYQRLA